MRDSTKPPPLAARGLPRGRGFAALFPAGVRSSAAALVLGGLALALALWGAPRLRTALERPETGIRRALDAPAPPVPLPLDPGGATLRIDRTIWTELVVRAQGDRPEVIVVAEADGVVAWRGAEVKVAYVGRERPAMVRRGGAWHLEGERLPRLAEVLRLLTRRASAFADADAAGYRALVSDGYRGGEGDRDALLRRLAADLGATPRARLRPLAWQVRIERETAQVGEDYEIAVGPGAPRRLRARFDLREEAGGWRFTGGL